jgi:hypothetical protein
LALVKTELSAMKLAYWVFAFVHGYRYEASKLKTEETEFFELYVKEQMLARPCQVEVIQFSKPCRVVLVFFFDKTRQDLLIRICQEKWKNLDETINRLRNKYYSLQLNYDDLHKLLEHCRCYPKNSIYAIDFIPNATCLCFTHDPRKKGSPNPKKLNYINGPQEMAETILHLNLDQSASYFDKNAV